MKQKRRKIELVCLTIFALFFSMLPLEDFLAVVLDKINQANIVDKLYLAKSDKNVIDNFRTGVRAAKANPGTRAKTVEFFMGQLEATAAGQANNTAYTYTAQTINLPESSVVVQSAYLEYTLEGAYTTLAYMSGFTLRFGQTAGTCPQVVTLNSRAAAAGLTSPAGAAETHVYDLRADVTADFSGYTGGTDLCAQSGYTFVFTAGTTGQIQSPSAKLVITYEYDDTSATQLNTVYYPIEYATNQGTKATQTAAGGNTNFTYTTTAPELAAAADLKSQFFEVNSNVVVTTTTDLNSTFCRFSGSCGAATGAHYFDAAQRSGGAFRFLVDALPGYTYNDSGAALRWTNTGRALNIQGGVNVMTYAYNSAAAVKTKTVRFGAGEVITAAASGVKSALTGPTVILKEGGVQIQKAWFKIETSTGAADTLTITTKAGANAETTADANDAYAIAMSTVDASQRDYIYHIIPAADYTEMNNNAGSGVAVQMAADWTTGGGSVSAELYITYTYTGEASGWTDTRTAFAGQQATNGATTWATAAGAVDPSIPDTGGTVAVASQYIHMQEYTVNSVANEARGIAIAAGACSSTNGSTAEITAIAKPIALFELTGSVVTTNDATTYTACYSSAQAALFNGVLVYTITVSINALTVTTSGTQAATLVSGSTGQHLGGAGTAAFRLQVGAAGPTVTSVKISDTGTVMFSGLTSPKLYYETVASCAYNGTESNVNGTYSGESVTFTLPSVALGSSPNYTCLYLVFDLSSSNTAGGQTIITEITNPSTDVVVSGANNSDTTAKNFASTTTIQPNATSTTWGAGLIDGGRSGESITVTGAGFGAAPNGSQASCAGAAGTGCVRFVVGGNATVADVDVTAWASTSITFSIDAALASYGGTAALEVVAGSQADANDLNFIIYPNITAIASLGGGPNGGGREYDAGDTDGLVMLSGDHFNAAGSVTILGSTAAQHATVESRCTSGGYSSTAVCVEVPAAIADNLYTGDIVLSRTADSKTSSSSNFQILPRLTSAVPATVVIGDPVRLVGNHLCQSGTCPTPPTGDASNKFTFTTGIDQTAFSAWSHTSATTTAPAGSNSGNVTLTSNTYVSNGMNLTVQDPTPDVPATLGQYHDVGLTQALAEGATASSTPIYLSVAMLTGVSGGTLYPQVEVKPVGTSFSCSGGGACGAATEGTDQAGPGPVTGSVAVSPADDVYHWQARVRHNKNSVDYYGAWASFGAAGEGLTDFKIDTTGAGISFPGGSCAGALTNLGTNGVTISWNLSQNGTGQVEYSKNSNLSSSINYPDPPAALASQHAITLVNLDSGTQYYFRVKSVDDAGIASSSPASEPYCDFLTSTVLKPARTTEFYIKGYNLMIAASAATSSSFSVPAPETAAAVKSAFVEITAISGSAGTNNFQVQVNSETAKTYAIDASAITHFRVIYPIAGLYLNDTPSVNTLTITPSLDTYIASARVVVTYEYTP
jgi:hypothetical protein